jgi:hypothetical protein
MKLATSKNAPNTTADKLAPPPRPAALEVLLLVELGIAVRLARLGVVVESVGLGVVVI